MNKFIVTAILLFLPCVLISQTITGKIVDTNKNPIPYTTLQIGPNYGVITNEEGVFNLEVEGFLDSEVVTISCLGYKSQDYKLSDFKAKTYVLEEAISELSEVFLTNKILSIGEILENVRANLSKNYAQNTSQRVFMRESNNYDVIDFDFDIKKSTNLNRSKIKAFNKELERIKDLVISTKSSNYNDVLFDKQNVSHSINLSVIKATKLINLSKDLSTEAVNGQIIKNTLNFLDSTSTYKLKTGLFTLEDSLKVGGLVDDVHLKKGKTKDLKTQFSTLIKNNGFGDNSKLDFLFEESEYEYIVEGISYINDEAAYAISFKPKRRSAKYVGKMYVNTSDYAVLKVGYQFAENRTGKKLNLKLVLGVKYVENAYKSTVIFRKNESGTYDLQFISQENGNYVYLDRSFKFIKNIQEEEDKQNLKLAFKIEQNQMSKVDLFFIENNSNADSNSFNRTDVYNIDYISSYDPSIWKDYNVISPVKAILEYQTE
jgi:hypothetical protein